MANKNKIELFIGLVLIIVFFICVIVVFYFMREGYSKKNALMEVRLANLINEKAQSHLMPSDYERARSETISEKDFLLKVQDLYSYEELNRREGILWLDRQGSKSMITLGAVHGLRSESRLDVYEGGNKIGSIRVDIPLDIISYVVPLEKSIDDFSNNYYRVVISE